MLTGIPTHGQVENQGQKLREAVIQNQRFGSSQNLKKVAVQVMEWAEKNGHDSLMKESTLALAKVMIELQKADIADSLAHSILNSSPISPPNIQIRAYQTLGFAAYIEDRSDDALELFTTALNLSKEANDPQAMAYTFIRLSFLFQGMGLQDTALVMARKSLSETHKVNDSVLSMRTYSSISVIYTQEGLRNEAYLDSAILLSQWALEIAGKLDYPIQRAKLNYSLSSIYSIRHEYDKALQYAKNILKFRSYVASPEMLAFYFTLGDAYFHKGMMREAFQYLDTIDSNLAKAPSLYYQQALEKRRVYFHKEAGHFETALASLEDLNEITDSLEARQNAANFKEIEQKYEQDKNLSTIRELKQQQKITTLESRLLWVAITVASLILLVVLLVYRQSVIRNEKNLLEAEQRLNRARMNPHFFFNALNALQSQILNAQHPESTATHLARYAQVMRACLESTFQEMISLEDEIEFLEEYLSLQQMIADPPFGASIEVDKSIIQSEVQVPAMMLQPILENAIEHGLPSSSDGKLSITISESASMLCIQVADNGKDQKQSAETPHTSRATQILNDRLMLLNRKHRSKARLEWRQNESGGRTVSILLPFIT